MQTRTKALIGGLAVLVIAAAATVVLRAGEPDTPLAELQVARQSVKVQRATGDVAQTEDTADLAVGDRVTTDAQGLGTVNWFDGSLTRLGGEADFVVKALSSAGDGRQIVGQLDFGQSWHRVKEATGSGSRFEVRTSDAIASVRGTTFLVRCIPNCRYGVVSGRVQVVTDGGETATLEGGEQVDVDESGKLGEVQPLDLEDPWLKLNQELDSKLPPLEGEDAKAGSASDADEADEGDAGEAPTSTTRQPFPTDPTTSPPTTSAPAGSQSSGDSTRNREPSPSPPPTTTTGTIPDDPPPPAPPPPPPPGPGSPDPGPPATSPPDTSDTTQPEPTTSSSTSSSSTTSSSTTSSSTTSSSTTSSSTTSTSAPTTTTPPTTSPPDTSPPSGGGGAPPSTTSSTAAPTTTTTTAAKTGSISGRVFEPDGSPFEPGAAFLSVESSTGLVIACEHAAAGDVLCPGTSIKSDGTFVISGLDPGTWDVFAVPPDSRLDLDLSLSEVVDLPAGEVVTGVDLTFVEVPLLLLSGTVVDRDGAAIEGAGVMACVPSTEVVALSRELGDCLGGATTGPDGGFSLLLPEGTYIVQAFYGLFDAVQDATLTPKTPPLELQILGAPAGSIDGTVIDTSGEPVGEATVTLMPTCDASSVSTSTDASGDYSFTDLLFCGYHIEVTPPSESGLSGALHEGIEIDPYFAPSHTEDFVLDPAPTTGSISGTVRTTDGTPVPGATVWACGPEPEVAAAAVSQEEVVVVEPDPCIETTADDGTYFFGGLSFGTWTLYADHELFYSDGVPVVLEPTAADVTQHLVLAYESEPIFCATECVAPVLVEGASSNLLAAQEPPPP